MKVKINIELFDDSSRSQLEEVGLTDKFLELGYRLAFEQYLKDLCKDSVEYALSVKIEDDTVI